MNRAGTYIANFVLLVGLAGCVPPDPPNIILIMADDLGYETLGANGGLSYDTPRLDRLAESGMRFTQAYSTPLCTPSRNQIMTGRYNFRNYVGFGLLDPAERTFAHELGDAGYATLVAGKWQLYGNQRQRELFGRSGTLPEDAGFDEYCLWQVEEVGGSRFKDPYLYISGEKPQVYEGEYGPDMVVSTIESFIATHADEPFFVYYPMILTHAPFQPTPFSPDYATFDESSQGSDTTYFAENVAYMDVAVGRIVDQLDRLGLQENTLVLFIGDNGTDRSITSRSREGFIRGEKGFTTSAGTHVPMIANWPSRVSAGIVNDQLIDFTDFMPTFLATARVSAASESRLDGLSFFGQLLGHSDSTRSWAFGDYAPRWGPYAGRRVRYAHDREWKLYDDSLFFHFSADPGEVNPVPDTLLTVELQDLKSRFQAAMDRLR